ncbi:MAG: HAMP domain-containing sensor histidine kinase [Dermatophilaceae bacterium]
MTSGAGTTPTTASIPDRALARTRRLPRDLRSLAEHLRGLPLRARLVAIMAALLLLGFMLTATATAYLMNRDLIGRVDANVEANAATVATRAYNSLVSGEETDWPGGYVVLFFDPESGERLGGMRPVDLDALPDLTSLPLSDPRIATRSAFTLHSESGDEKWRAVAGVTRNAAATYVVARPLTEVRHTLQHFVLFIVLLGLGMTAACGLLGWYAMRRAFRPLTQIEQTAAAIASGDLSSRVPTRPMPEEVASVASALNTMLTHVERSFTVREASEERMRQFVADASHELRTPLATVRGYAELYRQGAVPVERVPATMERIETEAARMSRLVDDLLLLARLDEQRPLQRAQVDLTVLAAEEVQAARVRDPERTIALIPRGGALGPLVVSGEEAGLHQVLGNLLTNAIRHTPEGTPIEVALGSEPDGASAVVEVRDHGTGIDDATATRIFERFFRADKGRSRASGGTGLGLAIVAGIIGRHGGRVGVAETPGGGATFVVEIPTAGSQADLRDC